MKGRAGIVGLRFRFRMCAGLVLAGLLAGFLLPPVVRAGEEKDGKGRLVIRGVVRSDEGKAIEGMLMLLLDRKTGDIAARTKSQSDGDYEFDGLEREKEYDVAVGILPEPFECGVFWIIADADVDHGVTTVNWTLYGKGRCPRGGIPSPP